MDNSLKTGYYIANVLNDTDELTDILGKDKIFPLIADVDTPYPFVIYERIAVNPIYSKVNGNTQKVQVVFRIYSDKYNTSLEISNVIRNLIERKSIVIPDEINIYDICLLSTSERYNNDEYVELLTFETTVV